jgi:hypothetical protein
MFSAARATSLTNAAFFRPATTARVTVFSPAWARRSLATVTEASSANYLAFSATGDSPFFSLLGTSRVQNSDHRFRKVPRGNVSAAKAADGRRDSRRVQEQRIPLSDKPWDF